LIRWKEALDLKSQKYQTPLLGLIEHLPECVPILFDRCITHSHDDRKHKDFHVKFFVDKLLTTHSFFLFLAYL